MPIRYGASTGAGIPGSGRRLHAKRLPRAIDDATEALHARVALAAAAPTPVGIVDVQMPRDEGDVAGVDRFLGEPGGDLHLGIGGHGSRVHGEQWIPQPRAGTRAR